MKTIKEMHEKYGDIQIKAAGAGMLSFDMILGFQGKLKKRSKENLMKLCERIFSIGFIAPFFLWDDNGMYRCLDGHGRIEALTAIKKAGVSLPPEFPVDYIQAANEKEAREILLSITSQYGEFDTDELQTWIDEIDDDIAETLRLVDGEILLEVEETESSEVEYTEKFQLIIELQEEIELQQLFEEMTGRGIRCKISTL